MKIVSVITFLLLIVTSTASAQWKKGDERVEDTPDRKSVNGVGGHLIDVENPREFIEEWLKPETPKIKIATDVKRGDLFSAFVLICRLQGGCSRNV